MKFSVKSIAADKVVSDCLVVNVGSKSAFSREAKVVDNASGKAISKLIRSGDFNGKLSETYMLHGLSGIKAKRVLVVGTGMKSKLDAKNTAKVLSATSKALLKSAASNSHIAMADLTLTNRDSKWIGKQLAQEISQQGYKYDHTKSKKNSVSALKSVSISLLPGTTKKTLEAALEQGDTIAKGMNTARQLGNLPGNICTPTFLAEQAKALGNRFRSLTVRVLTEKQMQRLGMGSLLSVSAGSIEEAKLIVINHKGAAKSSKPYVLVGKGITFDTGGISLKGGGAMDEMKFDMCGAASVVGTMQAVAELKLPVNVIGIIAAAENMPSDRATKPGDIVTSMAGKTIEILNTDAEGRLVLCDALTYAGRFDPKTVIDIATLTGAAVATFGSHLTAMMSNDDDLASALLESGNNCLDPAWQLPLLDEYQSMLNSNFADIANIGGPRAGTITAGCFLSRFTESYKWAHLDIAGSAWHSGAAKGATGRPVPLLVEYLQSRKA